jgi:hypothetical protein
MQKREELPAELCRGQSVFAKSFMSRVYIAQVTVYPNSARAKSPFSEGEKEGR